MNCEEPSSEYRNALRIVGLKILNIRCAVLVAELSKDGVHCISRGINPGRGSNPTGDFCAGRSTMHRSIEPEALQPRPLVQGGDFVQHDKLPRARELQSAFNGGERRLVASARAKEVFLHFVILFWREKRPGARPVNSLLDRANLDHPG